LPPTAEPIRSALIGRGLGGSAFHAPLLAALPEFELVRVAGSRDAMEAVSGDDVDLVVISTPNASHFPLARAALGAGKHVVIDKPFTVTIEEADDLIALASARNLVLSVFHNRRWDGDFLTVRSLLEQGALGQPMLVEMHWDRFRPMIKQGWREKPEPGSGLFNDLGPHMIDQAVQLFGRPQALQADLAVQRAEALVDDYFDVTLVFDGLRVRVAASTLISQPRPRFAVHGTDGSFTKHGLDPQEEALKAGDDPLGAAFGMDEREGVLTKGEEVTAIPTLRGCYPDYYRGVARAIRTGAAPPVLASEAREVQRLIALAHRSAAEGVRLPV
jgi:scyllo-inositol 2-dehydrogenase (NADP+)